MVDRYCTNCGHELEPDDRFCTSCGRPTSDLVVGSCAFKGPPTADGTVEIAYYTFGPYEGQGYAKAMARALISVAHSSPDVRHVIAHTLPERNPSTSVLRSVGMRFVGEVGDPDDGPVWRWQLESGD